MATTAGMLAEIPLFSLMDDDERSALAERMDTRSVSKGETIFLHGDAGDSLMVISRGKVQIYVSKADGTDIRQLTRLDFPAQVPCWSPDMSRIVFAGEPAGHSEIFVMNADGSGIVQLAHTGGDDSHPHRSADGSRASTSHLPDATTNRGVRDKSQSDG